MLIVQGHDYQGTGTQQAMTDEMYELPVHIVRDIALTDDQ